MKKIIAVYSVPVWLLAMVMVWLSCSKPDKDEEFGGAAAGPEGIHISIDGRPSKTYKGMATAMDETGQFSIGSLRLSQDIPQIVFLLPRKPGRKADGVYPWAMEETESKQVTFEYAEPNLQKMYVSVYEDGSEVRDSKGTVSVQEFEQGGKKYVAGEFAVEQAGVVETTTGSHIGVVKIKGSYKVQRNW